MAIYIIRHTAPSIAKGVCYGQADIDVVDTFSTEAAIIQRHLPNQVWAVYSSPLQRCKKLAEHLFPGHTIQLDKDLKEINCGDWELKLWDVIPFEEINPWMEKKIDARMPGGESYHEVFERSTRCFDEIIRLNGGLPHLSGPCSGKEDLSNIVIIAHGGVIRSILSYITDTPLAESFQVFSLYYGCVIKITWERSVFRHELLSNIVHEKETHKPSRL